MIVTHLKIKMIGTTAVEESSEEILYPSITVCPKNRQRARDDFNEQNLEIFQRSFNMSEVILNIKFYQKNTTDHWNKEVIKPMESGNNNRDKIVICFSNTTLSNVKDHYFVRYIDNFLS